jgi:hypothetical protein
MLSARLFNRDSITGAIFISFGAAALWIGSSYSLGSGYRIGPGFMVSLLGWPIVIIGAIVSLRGWWSAGVTRDDPLVWHWRPVSFILLAILLFGLLIDRIGLVGTTMLCILVAGCAERPARLLETALLAVGLTVAVVAIFIYGLGLPLSLWGH